MKRQHFDIQILDAPLGAEIIDYKLRKDLDDNDADRLHSALADHYLLVFRRQSLAPHLQQALGRRLVAQSLAPEGEASLFANLQMAYDTLPVGLRRVVHSVRAEQEGAAGPLPLVRMHPETGRRSLLVADPATTRLVGTSAAQSDELLQELQAHAVRPQHLYCHHWQPQDLLFWDPHSVAPVHAM